MEKYKIKILHILNPHLIWAETMSKDQKTFQYIQLGLHGIMPLSPHIDNVLNELKFEPVPKWTPGANVVMYKSLEHAVSVWFQLKFVDHRNTIFDTTDHLYGDIIVKSKKDGAVHSLTQILLDENVAYKNPEVFNESLGNGKLGTSLNDGDIGEVISCMENVIRNDQMHNAITKSRIEALHARLTVFFQMQSVIEEFGKRNETKQYIENVHETFMYIKDCDVVSYGRGTVPNTRVKDKDNSIEDEEKLSTVRMKRIQQWVDEFDKLKLKDLPDNNDNTAEETPVISKFFTRRKLKAMPEQVMTDTSHSYLDSDDNNSISLQSECQGPAQVSKFFANRNKTTDYSRNNNVDSDSNTNSTLQPENHKPSVVSKFFTRRNRFAPPQPPPVQKIADTSSNTVNSNTVSDKEGNSPGPVSKFFTRPMKRITTENVISHTDNGTSTEVQSTSKLSKFLENRNIKTQPDEKVSDHSRNNIDSDNSTNATSQPESLKPNAVSKFFTRRLKYIKNDEEKKQLPRLIENRPNELIPDNENEAEKALSEFAKNFMLKTADTTPAHSDVVKVRPIVQYYSSSVVSDTDYQTEAACLLDKMERDNPQTIIPERQPKENNTPAKTKCIKANVFNNISPNISKFVDRLVTPVLMVHTKHDECIEPLVDMREFHFNQTIRSTLSSMCVKGPMMVQSIAWYTILRGYSTFVISPLNSGKTLSYTPSVCQLVADYNGGIELAGGQGPVCIIMCATASSVIDVARQCRSFLKKQGTVLSFYPGVDEEHMTFSLINGCDIFVCTPCALVRFLGSMSMSSLDLKRLSVCVFDNFERLNEAYINEVQYLLLKIKEESSSRVDKVQKVQFVIASRTWCSLLEQLAKKCFNTVICIGAYQECVLYSKAHTTVSFVQSKNKLGSLIDFFNESDSSKRAVVVCRTNEEVREVAVALIEQHRVVVSADNTMTVEGLYKLSTDWFQYDDPMIAPVLVCCDSNLAHLNITNACYLFHYSLPNLYSEFCKRFSSLTDNFSSIFEEGAQNNVKIGILLEENNAEQLPKIVNFTRRIKNEIPDVLNNITESVSTEKDRTKAECLVPICDKLLLFGHCVEYWNCRERHRLFKTYDTPQDWCPKTGVITYEILHFKSAVAYSVRLLSNTVNGVTKDYPQNQLSLRMKMALYYSKEDNKRPHGTPVIGDLCAVGKNAYTFERCQIIKILNTHQNGKPDHVLVKLIDEGEWYRTKDINLHYLPDILKNIIPYVVEVKLCGLKPMDRDVMFSDLAEMHLRNLIGKEKAFYIRSKVVAVIGNNIMVENLTVCQDLSSLKTRSVRYNIKEELLGSHALENKEHIPKLLEMCQKSGLIVKDDEMPSEAPPASIILPKPQWAHLDKNDLSLVYFASADHPGRFFVRHVKFDDCLQLLTNDIQNYMREGNVESVSKVVIDQYVLAKFPDDSLYYRARVDEIDDAKIKCFFVDHGDWRYVNITDIHALTEGFIKKIPFQAIECRLVALKPPGEEWPEISTNWFCNLCFDGDTEDSKPLYVKYFTKETAECTDGNKYGVVVVDTTGNDLIFNQAMLEANFARADDDEIQYLEECVKTFNVKVDDITTEEKLWEMEAEPYLDKKFVRKLDENNQLEGSKGSLMNTLFAKVPQNSMTFDEDDYDLDAWDMEINESEFIKSLGLPITPDTCTSATPESFVKLDSAEANSDFEILSPVPKIVELPKEKELLPVCEELLKPKVVWHQKDSTVVVKIEVLGMLQYEMDIKQRALQFKTTVHDKVYGFEIDLYGIVDPDKSKHAHKGLYVQLKLAKLINKKWLALHEDEVKRKWIVYDHDALDFSSDEDAPDTNLSSKALVDLVKSTYYDESDAESDIHFRDDLEFQYKHDSDYY